MNDDPVSISDIINKFLKKTKIDQENEFDFIIEKWNELAGPEISKYTQPFKFKDGRLFIKVKNSVINSEIQYKKEELTEKINNVFKEKKIFEIITKIGR